MTKKERALALLTATRRVMGRERLTAAQIVARLQAEGIDLESTDPPSKLTSILLNNNGIEHVVDYDPTTRSFRVLSKYVYGSEEAYTFMHAIFVMIAMTRIEIPLRKKLYAELAESVEHLILLAGRPYCSAHPEDLKFSPEGNPTPDNWRACAIFRSAQSMLRHTISRDLVADPTIGQTVVKMIQDAAKI